MVPRDKKLASSSKKYPRTKSKMIHIRLAEDTHKRLRILAANQETTIQELVAQQIEKLLKNS